jgi:hypothetical protein
VGVVDRQVWADSVYRRSLPFHRDPEGTAFSIWRLAVDVLVIRVS